MTTDLRIFVASFVCALLATIGCARLHASEAPLPSSSAHEDLLMGYDLLEDTLADESNLGTLKILKTITFSGPAKEVGEVMDVLAKASERRKEELEHLRKLAPDVTAEPKKRSPIGDAITAVAKEIGTDEMLDWGDGFNLRFLLLQAQATRMISAIATAIAEYEPNVARREWLGAVAAEYEAYRDQIVEAILEYTEGSGAAPTDR